MSALTRQPDSPFPVADWHGDVTQLLDEHHLVAWSTHARLRVHFAASLGQFLGGLRDVEVCTFYGRSILTLDDFCCQLERALEGPMLERRIDGLHGVAALLRSRPTFGRRAASKYRYYIWHDADVLLRHDPKLFGRVIETIFGVGAESEYVSDDLLLIHRAVFVGGPTLDLYAEDPAGQFQSWVRDDAAEPFWQVVTGIEKPATMRYQIDLLGK